MAPEVTSDPIVRMEDLRAMRPKVCTRGARTIAAQLGIDWQDFLAYGVRASVLKAAGNAFCDRLIKTAQERANER